MISTISDAVSFDCFCPDCHRCLGGERDVCPECERSIPEGGWPSAETSPHPFLGHTIDERYRLERYLGGGSAGQVYRARDLELDRPFALKILDVPHAPGTAKLSKIRRRFENEVEALSRIRNPHVVNIHEALTLEGGVPAMLMEYIEGPTLEEIMGSVEGLDLDQILVISHQIANGLYEAHQRGVVHRDVKPANIIVERLPASGLFTRLLDFGLVHLVGGEDQSRGFRGTPLYAAPEQCRGESSVTHAADIYSLGCLIFHLVARRPPFVGDDPRAIIFSHVDEQPPTLAEVAPEEVAEELDELVMEMLEKDPDARPADLSLVVGTLEKLMRTGSSWQSLAIAETGEGLGSSTSEFADRDGGGSPEDNAFLKHASDTPQLTQLVQFTDLGEEFSELAPPIVACAVADAGDCAVFSDSDGGIFATSLGGEGFAASYRSQGERVVGLAVDSRIGQIAGVTEAGTFLRWRLAEPDQEPVRVYEFESPVFALEIGSARQRLYWASQEGEFWTYDERVERAERICSFPRSVTHLQVDPGENEAVATTLAGEVLVVRNLQRSGTVRTAVNIGSEPSAVAYHGESRAILIASTDDMLYSYRLDGDRGLESSDLSVSHLRGLAITAEAQILGLSLRGASAQTWRIRHERLTGVFDWLGVREMSSKTAVSRSILERVRGESPDSGE